jgi:RimJ/RimL family protein N-acetyltransferase
MKTPRLQLVRLTEDHLPGYHAIWSDKKATRWSPHGYCKTLEDSKRWMSELLISRNPNGDNFAVIIRSDIDTRKLPKKDDKTESEILQPGRFIGWVGTWTTLPTPEVGFIFHPDAWGYGFASEALQGFVTMFWELKLQYNTLDAVCDAQNAASISVLTKCGFVIEQSMEGYSTLPWMDPPLRDCVRFRVKRSVKINMWCLAK